MRHAVHCMALKYFCVGWQETAMPSDLASLVYLIPLSAQAGNAELWV